MEPVAPYVYPVRATPVAVGVVAHEIATMLRRGGFHHGAQLCFTEALDAEHLIDPRRYGQVHRGGQPRFEFARAVFFLPDAQRIGLEAHEVGHVLDPIQCETSLGPICREGVVEARADVMAWTALGIRIVYDKRWPGRGLQTAVDLPDWLR